MARAMMTKFLMTMMLIELALAVDHPVGAPTGSWDTSTDLDSWASSQTFTVGDNIVFSYTPTHNVVEVSMDDYDSCSTSNAISSNSLAPTTIALTAAGSRYFICGTPGHCDQGMKVEIKTVAADSAPPTTTTPTSPSPPSSSSPDTPASTTPGTPAPVKPSPSPSSAETIKMTVVSVVGLGLLMMVLR